jgi:hypothetical protein
MAKSKTKVTVREAGAWKVKAAESRSSRVQAKTTSRTHTPSNRDKKLGESLLNRRGSVPAARPAPRNGSAAPEPEWDIAPEFPREDDTEA